MMMMMMIYPSLRGCSADCVTECSSVCLCVEAVKTVKRFEDMKSAKFCSMSDSVCRSHRFTLSKQHVKLNVGKFSFTQRFIDEWNNFKTLVKCRCVGSFKQESPADAKVSTRQRSHLANAFEVRQRTFPVSH